MAVEYNDRAYLIVDGSEVECEEITWRGVDEGEDIVGTMNRQNRGRGFTSGIKSAELNATIPVPKVGLPVNLDEMWVNNTIFTAVIEYEGGGRRLFRNSKITNIEGSNRSGDKGTMTASIKSLNPSYEPPT